MQVLAALALSDDGLSLAQLSDQLQVPKTSLFSLLRSLDKGGYIDSQNGHHRLGKEAYSLSAMISKGRQFPDNVRSALRTLHEQSMETVMVAVPGDSWSDLVYVDVIESDSWLRFRANIGSRRPLYCTSSGLALLAFAPALPRAKYLESLQLAKFTPGTVSSKRALVQILAQFKVDGVAVSSGSVEGATGISAPFFDGGGNVAGAVSLAGLTPRISRNETALIKYAKNAGEKMSRILGYIGPYPPA